MVLSLVIFFRSGTDFRGAVGRSFLGRSSHRKFPRSEVKPQTPSFAHFALLDLSLLLVTLTFPLLRFCAILVMMPCQSDTQTRGPEDLFNLVRRQLYFFHQQSSAIFKTLSLKVDTNDPMYGTAQSVGNITAPFQQPFMLYFWVLCSGA